MENKEQYIGPVLDARRKQVRKLFVSVEDSQCFLIQKDYLTGDSFSNRSLLGSAVSEADLEVLIAPFTPAFGEARAIERAEVALTLCDASSINLYLLAESLRSEPNGELATKLDNQEFTLTDLNPIINYGREL